MMKVKLMIGVLLLFGMIELNGQIFKADSAYRFKFRNVKQLVKDAEKVKIRAPKRKTKWEYDSYEAKLTDSTFTFCKLKTGVFMSFKIIEDWREDSSGDCLRLFAAKNECDDVIYVNYIPVDELTYSLVVYFQGEDLNYYATYLTHRYNELE
jgi:hypothetical protein